MVQFVLHSFEAALDASLKVLLLAGITGLLLLAARIRDSSVKHADWRGVLASFLALPLLSPLIPTIPIPWLVSLELPQPASGTSVAMTAAPIAAEPSPTIADRVPVPRGEASNGAAAGELAGHQSPIKDPAQVQSMEPAPVSSSNSISSAPSSQPSAAGPANVTSYGSMWSAILAVVWAMGFAVLSARLAFSICLTRRLVRRSKALHPSELPGSGSWLAGWNLSSIDLRESPLIFVPMSTGCLRPSVLLPANWRDWSVDKSKHVLVHELTHLRRGDCWTNVAAEFLVAAYWFHPLAWWLKRRLAALAEECCDDAAIATEGNRAKYARHLLEIASAMRGRSRRLNYAGLAMARRSCVERRIRAILDDDRPLSRHLTWCSAALVICILLPFVAVAAALKPARETAEQAQRQRTDADSRQLAAASAEPRSAKNLPEKSTNPASGNLVKGQVFDSQKRPIAGVSVAIRRLRLLDRSRTLAATARELARVTTNGAGEYEYFIPAAQLPKPYLGFFDHVPEWIQVVAKHPGYGLDTANFAEYEPERTYDLRLIGDVAVQGRLLDAEGRPVPAVEVRVLELVRASGAQIDDWHRAAIAKQGLSIDADQEVHRRMFERPTPESARLLTQVVFHKGPPGNLRVLPTEFAPTKTDTEGRFELRGLGVDRLAALEFSAPHFERSLVNVVTRPMQPVKDFCSFNVQTFYGARFEYVIGPSADVEGVVRDAVTKRPLVGALVTTDRVKSGAELHIAGNERQSYPDWFITTVTDSAGRYRLEGLSPLERPDIKVFPPENEPYLVTGDIEVPKGTGLQPVTIDVELRKGVWATGQVYDVKTKQPVRASIRYSPFLTNPFLERYPQFSADNFRPSFNNERLHATDAEGRFRIPVIPGRGVIAAKIPERGFITGYGQEAIPEFASLTPPRRDEPDPEITCDQMLPGDFHSLREISPADDAESIAVDLPVDRGISVRFSFVDPDGKPLARVYTTSIGDYESVNTMVDSSTVTASGFRPGRPCLLGFSYFEDVNRSGKELRKLLTLTPEADGESVTVRLEPLAKVRGRVIDKHGNPWPVRSVLETYVMETGQTFGPYNGNGSRPFPDRRFELGLTTGCAYRLTGDGDESVNYRKIVVAEHLVPKAGEVIDLGDIVVDAE